MSYVTYTCPDGVLFEILDNPTELLIRGVVHDVNFIVLIRYEDEMHSSVTKAEIQMFYRGRRWVKEHNEQIPKKFRKVPSGLIVEYAKERCLNFRNRQVISEVNDY